MRRSGGAPRAAGSRLPAKPPLLVRGLARAGRLALRGLLGFVFRRIRSSWPYREGVRRAVAHAEVRRVLGDPVEPGWFVAGAIHVVNDNGTARLQVPLSGPRGFGVLRIEARKTAGDWRLETCEVGVAGRAPIDVLPATIDVRPVTGGRLGSAPDPSDF